MRPRITAFNLAACGWGAILLLAPASAAGQQLETRLWPTAETVVAFGHPDDYRWEGALVGGVGLGLFGTYLAVGFCGDGDSGSGSQNCVVSGVLGLLFGATLGVVTGGLLGGLIPKEKP